jgi:hypothetical protein
MSTRNKLRAFVLYSAADRIVPGVLVLRSKFPNRNMGRWVEVAANKCCPPANSEIPAFFRNQGNLKAFIKYDKGGHVIASSTILRPSMPKHGIWVEIPVSMCCIYTTTTSTSTTTTTSTSTSTSTTSSTTTTTTTLP